MKYVCQICGYVYDEDREGVKWEDLPPDWRCPICTAPKSAFAAESPSPEPASVSGEAYRDETLGAGELAAICSNLARGCEKQYDDESRRLFAGLSEAFSAAAEKAEANVERLAEAVRRSAEVDFAAAKSVAENAGDRGALRALVWGEKVAKSLSALLDRFEAEGGSFLENAEIWVCTICGFVYVGDAPPELCPVCKVPSWKFEKAGGKVV